MYKKSKKKKKNKIKVSKGIKKCGLSKEEMFSICNTFRVRDCKILVLNTSYKNY